MLSFLWALLSFIIAIGLLVSFHEFGHFIVARQCGVKVLRFSIGFGKALWSKKGKSGTEYVIAAIPLGGYVKMLDEAEGEVAPEELAYAFNRKPIWARTLIVLAGPVFNLIFAVFAYWLMFVIGITHMVPILDSVPPQSIAGQAGLQQGDKIIAVGKHKTKSWHDVNLALFPHLGEKGVLKIRALRDRKKQPMIFTLDLKYWKLNIKKPNILKSLGLIPFLPRIPAIVAKVSPNGPAAKAGLQPGDRVIAVGGTTIHHWRNLAEALKPYGDKTVTITIIRQNQQRILTITPKQTQSVTGKRQVLIGIRSKPMKLPQELTLKSRYSIIGAWGPAFKKTGHMIALTGSMIYKMVTGQVSVRALSGPVGIAQGAGQSAQLGISYYLAFLGLISISLGIINLLPIPVLDGGHLLYYLIEVIRRKPLSLEAQAMGMQIGIVLLLGLMLMAILNDFIRLFY